MAADIGLENLKTECIAALRNGDEDAFETAAVNLQEYAPDDLHFKMETLGLLTCLALKQNCRRSALKALNLLSVCSLDSRRRGSRKHFFAEPAFCGGNGGAHAR